MAACCPLCAGLAQQQQEGGEGQEGEILGVDGAIQLSDVGLAEVLDLLQQQQQQQGYDMKVLQYNVCRRCSVGWRYTVYMKVHSAGISSTSWQG